MRIQHNMESINTSRQLNIVNGKLSGTQEKLSTGYKINRASDNAAGLQISEKMRSQIRGLNQASKNAQDGISLIQTAEGALNEVESIVQRMRELSVQAANDTNCTEDRNAVQEEINELSSEVTRISKQTEFNRLKLLNGSIHATSPSVTPNIKFSLLNQNPEQINAKNAQHFTYNDALSQLNNNEFGLFIDTTLHYETTQTPSGTNETTGYDEELKNCLETEIVPNAVQSLLNTYEAFQYLHDSSVGIGLKLYSDTSSTLAYVSISVNGYPSTDNINFSYQLAINMNSVQWDSASKTITNRSDLEATLAHEMTHALMFESMSTGMLGVNGSFSTIDEFPKWFKEGTAQLGSGPGNWVKYSLNFDPSSTDSEIKSKLSKLSTNSNEACYGTGYLACAYLGYLINGGTGSVTASSISTGINKIFHGLISGMSLDDSIDTYTNGKYTSLTDFANNLQNDTDVCSFIRELITNTGDGLGSVVSGDLSAKDVLNDSAITTLKLFELDPDNNRVTNNYKDTGVTPFSGGSVSQPGDKPITTYPDPPSASPTLTTTINLDDLSSVDWVALDASYDTGTQTITLNNSGSYNLTGTNSAIKIQANTGTDITLNGTNATISEMNGDGGSITINGTLTGTIRTTGNINNTGILTGSCYTEGSGNINNTGTIIENAGCENGTINNYGQIGLSATHGSSGSVKHYVSTLTKNIVEPEKVPKGDSLPDIAALGSSITVTYNGTSQTINGTWIVKDSSGNVIANPSSITMGENDSYTYSLSFDGTGDDLAFDASTSVTPSMTFISYATTPDGGTISPDGRTLTYSFTVTAADVTAPAPTTLDGITLQIGANSSQHINITIDDMSSTSLGIDSLNMSTHTNASNAISLCDTAIAKISSARSELGASQNRLEHMITSTDNTAENLENAESRIRDTDMANEIVRYYTQNMLQQSGQFILAQANQQQNNILSLLH